MEKYIFNKNENRNRLHVLVVCSFCQKEIWKDKRYIKSTKHFFCNREHKNKFFQKREEVICSHCGKKFEITPSRKLKSKCNLFFCSKKCKSNEQKIGGKINISNYREGRSVYRDIAFRTYEPKCEICNYSEFIEILQVHHIDENRENNNPDNLMILCPICHAKITMKIGKLQKRVFYYI